MHHRVLPEIIASIAAVLLLAADDPKPKVSLVVAGEVERPLSLSASDLAGMPGRRTVKVKDHKGVDAEFEGVPLIDVLRKAGARVDDRLRGGALADYLVIEASDGYRAVFALAELDPAFTDRVILLADRRDGRAIDATEGPLRIVVPGEKKHARWVRQVTGLTIRRAPTVPVPPPVPASPGGSERK